MYNRRIMIASAVAMGIVVGKEDPYAVAQLTLDKGREFQRATWFGAEGYATRSHKRHTDGRRRQRPNMRTVSKRVRRKHRRTA
jgi:hypothetical protein